ncbi:MAG: hypothetical protein Q9163_001268 [Psora crenata]
MVHPSRCPPRPNLPNANCHFLRNRGARKHISYAESASDPVDDDSLDDFDPEHSQARGRVRQVMSQSTTARPETSEKRKVRRVGHGRDVKSGLSTVGSKKRNMDTVRVAGKDIFDIRFTGKAMPWHTLPYHILQVIFDYAAYPLVAENFCPTASMPWLVRMACMCKAFTEPALSVLYSSPPLFPPARVRQLIAHLQTQDERSLIDYRAKIKHIHLEGVYILGRKSDGQDPIDPTQLLTFTPQLRSMGIHLLSDNPKWSNSIACRSRGRTTYPPGIVSTMVDCDIRLRNWTWNGGLARENYSLQDLHLVHATPPFQSLRSLTFIDYPASKLKVLDGTLRRADILLAQALEALPVLRSLAFRKSPIVGDGLLSRLPKDLQSLEITDCPIQSCHIVDFLQTRGSELRRLILDHNRYLNLSWLSSLALSSPKLEVLKMDLLYHNIYASVSDSEPKYAYLLAPNDTPTWPPSLQVLELYHLRKWSTNVATLFFSSLTSSAPSLPNLRQLRIKASLDESGWRDRIAFRDKWVRLLQKVFLRVSPLPNPHLKSIPPFEAHRAHLNNGLIVPNGIRIQPGRVPLKAYQGAEDNKDDGDSDSKRLLAHRRYSKRIQSAKSDNQASVNSIVTGQRKHHRRRRHHTGPDESSEEDSALEDETIDFRTRSTCIDDDGDPPYIQGMCDMVDVVIDNLRPTEEQLHECDFLDDEASGDEDWNGNDFIPGDSGYAW